MRRASSLPPGSGRILVVEDEQDVAELLRYHLGKEGDDVVVAANGNDAVKRARELHPEVCPRPPSRPYVAWATGCAMSRRIVTQT